MPSVAFDPYKELNSRATDATTKRLGRDDSSIDSEAADDEDWPNVALAAAVPKPATPGFSIAEPLLLIRLLEADENDRADAAGRGGDPLDIGPCIAAEIELALLTPLMAPFDFEFAENIATKRCCPLGPFMAAVVGSKGR